MVKFLQKPKNCCSLQITVFPLIIGVTMAFFRMQFVKFNNRFFNLKVCWCHFEGKCNTQHFDEFFWQNREKSKYRFWTFLPVTWVKIELQRPTIHQMNGWNLYFLAYFMQSIRKLNLRGPRTSDISLKFIESPFIYLHDYLRNVLTKCTEGPCLPRVLGLGKNRVTWNSC